MTMRREISVTDLLRSRSAEANANLILTKTDLSTLRPERPTWVFGDRDLVDDVFAQEGLDDIVVFELVRSDTGWWYDPLHAGSMPLRYFSRGNISRLSAVAITRPSWAFVLEHEGRLLSRSALVRVTFGASPNHGFFHARLDSLISSPAPPGEVTDLSAYFAEDQPDLIIEGPKAMLKQRIEDAKQAVKQEQRKTAVGSQLRLSVGNQDTAPLCAPGVTWSAVGASFSAGLTIFADDNIWPALQRCLAASDWRGSIIRDSPQWVTVGCVDDHCLLALIRTLRAWREQVLLPADLRFRLWTLEYSHHSPDRCCLILVQNGVIWSYSTTATARHIAAEISEDPLRRYLKAKQIAADVHISGVGPERRLEICGDVERLQGTTIFLTGLPPNRHEVFSVSFNATGPAADASLTTSLPSEAAAGDASSRPGCRRQP